ncbi:MAG TPA: OmpA family protein [Tenuifilaceae bacterium]|nr:OmpA family protein [Tenuifilaceae bacterium]
MTTVVKYFLSFLFLLWSCHLSFAQYYIQQTQPNIEAKFTRHSLEAKAKQTFFNVLKIKNNSNRPENFILNITVPQGWNVIGKDKFEININPLDSIIVPLRIAIAGNVRGDIGYSVIASISDTRGNTIKNEYCFVKIPRETDLVVKFSNRIFYLDPISNTTEFSVQVSNKGNREELMNFIFDGNRLLSVNSEKTNLFAKDIIVPPFTDTSLTFDARLLFVEHQGKEMFSLATKITTIDTVYNNTLWFKLLKSEFKNNVPSSEKPLRMEFYAQGLLDAYISPTYSLLLEGKTLFKGNSDIYYYYRNFASQKNEDLYKYNRMYIGSHIGSWTLEVGDSYRSIESQMSGRGGYIAYENNRVKAEAIVYSNELTDFENIGGTLKVNLNKKTFLYTGTALSENKSSNFSSKLGLLGAGFSLNRRHNFYLQGSLNQITRGETPAINNEYGWEFNYNSNYKKISSIVRAKYGSEQYYSPYGGRLELFSIITWQKNPTNQFQLYFSENHNNVSRIDIDEYLKLGYLKSREGKLLFRHLVNSDVEVFAGPVLLNYKSSDIYNFPVDQYFSSLNSKATLGARIKNSSGTAVLMPSIEVAWANVTNNPFINTDSLSKNRKSFGYYNLAVTFRSRSFLILAFFNSGPRSLYDQVNYLQNSKQSRKLQFIPTFDRFVYKDIVKVQVGLNYTNDMMIKSRYTNIIGQVNWYLPRDWEFQALGVYSLQHRMNYQDLLETYQNLYLELGIKKDFNINQPRVRYHDIELSFFKDFNGNYLKDENEPGVKNVLVSMEKTSSEAVGRIPGDFYGGELISDNTGNVSFEDIPEGIYKISYNPVGSDLGSYSKAKDDIELRVNRSGKYFFPFVEKNKVFGKIVLNRSRLSGLGKVDISNIRITATDSRGNTFSTLTDKEGGFIIYAPVTDEYIVNINNIFYEDFDLRQNNFRVQFNGYKQFEVNFVFDEKIRRINFSPSTQDNLAEGVLQIRRTNLRGTIKDATTLNPLRARINLVNTKNNSIVSSVYSNPQTGDYSLSFLADDIYLLEIVADDYWYFSENLNLNQVTTFMNVTRDILLKQISIGSKMELNIKFVEINQSTLGPETVAELNRLLHILKDNSNIKVEIQGHCDDLEAINNPQIGEERAKSVAKYLVENGFSNLQVRGFGNTSPIAPSDSEENRTLNRRVEIEVISK